MHLNYPNYNVSMFSNIMDSIALQMHWLKLKRQLLRICMHNKSNGEQY